MNTVFVVLAALSAGLLAFAILDVVFSEERKVKRVLKQMSAYEAEQAREVEPLLLPFFERIIRPALASIVELIKHLGPADLKDKLRKRLVLAGNPRGFDVDRFLSLKVLAVLVVFALIILVALLKSISSGRTVFYLMVLLPLAFFVPDFWLSQLISKRQQAIRRSLPDMLDMLTISVEAGLGFDAALTKLIKNSSGPLAEEFGKMLQEVQAGASRSDGLRHLAERTDVAELKSFIMAMIQADVFGISITNVLRTQAQETRLKRRQHAEEVAQKAPVKIVFPVVVCLLPATLLVIVGPAIVSIGRAFGLIAQ